MIYALIVAGSTMLLSDKYECYDNLHALGADLSGESYTVTYNENAMDTELHLDHPNLTASCVIIGE